MFFICATTPRQLRQTELETTETSSVVSKCGRQFFEGTAGRLEGGTAKGWRLGAGVGVFGNGDGMEKLQPAENPHEDVYSALTAAGRCSSVLTDCLSLSACCLCFGSHMQLTN